jgi:hypothetical protein
MNLTIKLRLAPVTLLVMCASSFAESVSAGEVNSSNTRIRHFDVSMDADEYRESYQENRHHIQKYLTSHSEKALTSLGLSSDSVHILGAIVGSAATQDATLYLNSSKSLAIDVKDAAADDRAIYFGYRLKW